MPVRPRHCNGQQRTLETPLATGREGERCGPEPGDDLRPRHDHRPSGEGWWRTDACVRTLRASLGHSDRMPVLRSTTFTSRRSGRARRAWLASAALAIAPLVAAGCRDADPPADVPADMRADTARSAGDAAPARLAVVDDFGDTLRLAAAARRVVSLNPTTTELMFALGADERLVGRSRWDEWPDAAKAVPDVGDGIRPNVEAILATRPDLVLLYASQDNRPAAERLQAAGVATLSLKIDSIAQFRRATITLGEATGRGAAARATVDSVDATLARVRRLTSGRARPTVLWRAWDVPLLVIGGGSFLHELIDIAGGRNVFGDLAAPSPQVSFEEVLRRDPDVLIGGEMSATKLRADAQWRTLAAVREGRILAVDDAIVARPSVRLGEAAVALARGLHPALADSLAAPR